jgi:hypothetical protein
MFETLQQQSQQLFAVTDFKVNTVHATVIIRSRARPMRSASMPASQPPKAEMTGALVASNQW